MNLLPVIIWFSTVLGIVFVRGKVIVQNGGYTNVLVSFSQAVSEGGGKAALEQLQVQLNSASQILQTAIGLRISEVTVLVPRSWDTADWNETVNLSSASTKNDVKADILVSAANDTVFGGFPHAVQFGSCATPGHQIIIPEDFITGESSFPKGSVIAREWLKYRYGVFDENGYPGDELYPLYYKIPGVIEGDAIVTGCTNTPIEYAFYRDGNNCSEEELHLNQCKPEPIEESLENVTSSLMYFHEHIPNMEHVCGTEGHPHAKLARNKHNTLCQGLSVWDVLNKFSDFRDSQLSDDETAVEETESIKFTYVLEPAQKVVIAWENTHHLEQQGELILNAIRKFVYELPKGTKIALFPFTDKVEDKKVIELRELVEWPTDWAPKLVSPFQNPTDGCIICALNKALDILDSDLTHSGKETIILISSSKSIENQELLKRIQNSEVCLMILVFSDNTTLEEYEKFRDESKCGTLVEFSKTTNHENFQRVFEAMESILPETVDDRKSKTVEIKVMQKGVPLEITIDPSVEKITFWIFKLIEIDSIQVTFNDKELSLVEEIYDNIIALPFIPESEGSLKFELKYGSDVLMHVRVTSKRGEYISGNVFTHDLSADEATTQEPVILYARVLHGAYPVQNAEVVATVSRPYGEESIELELFDNGKGDPDITANDGIYSRYFTSFSSEGEYTVNVTVTGTELSTAGKLTNEVVPSTTCCGRSVKQGSHSLKSFTESFHTKFTARSARPETGYKPSRITDLQVENMTEDKITLTWTAPGAEGDSGTADSYCIKYFTSQEDVQDFDKGKFLNHTAANNWGVMEKYEAYMKEFGENAYYYIAIKSNNGNISSETSNIVEVYISNPETSTVPETVDLKVGSSKTRTITIIIGVVVGIIVLVIIMYLIIYFVALRSRREKKKKDGENSTRNNISQAPNENHAMNPINFISVDTLIKHHTEKTKAKLEHKTPPVLKEEDFEQKPTNTEDSVAIESEIQEHSSTDDKSSLETQPFPPKSPKRITNV